MNIQALVAAVVIALAIGFAGGWYTKGKFVDAAEVTQVRKDTKQGAANVVEAAKLSQVVTTKVDASNTVVDQIQTAAAGRVIKYQPRPQPKAAHDLDANTNDRLAEATTQPVESPVCNPGDLVLDAGTVRLLNAARQGATVDASTVGHGEKPRPANPAD